MSELTFLTERAVTQELSDRVANAERLRTVRRHRPRRRHSLALRLHRFADRLDV